MKKMIPSYVRVPLIFALVFGASEYFIDSGEFPAFIKYPMVSVFLIFFLFLLVAIEIVAAAIERVTDRLITAEQREALEAQEVPFMEKPWVKKLLQKFNSSHPVEKEAEVLLEHDYDGIRELDNVLPPWWVNLFYATIVFGLIYMVRYHVMGADNQEQEFKQEVELANIEIAKNKANSPTKEVTAEDVTLLTDAASLAKGKEIFANACAACHKADGGGVVGPNLTDEYWVNGGGIKNVFKLIAEGSKKNPTMVGWAKTIGSDQVQNVASYVISLQGSKPAGAKPAEGDKWVDETPTAGAAVADTTKTVTK